MGSETAAPNLFGEQTESDTAVGTILRRGLGRFRAGFDDPMRSYDPLVDGDLFCRRQNRRDGDFGCQETENTPTARYFSVSEVDYHHLGSGTPTTMRPSVVAEAGTRGLVKTNGNRLLRQVLVAYLRMPLLTSGQWTSMLINQTTSGSVMRSFNISLTCVVSQLIP
jgi:hypothetical protein